MMLHPMIRATGGGYRGGPRAGGRVPPPPVTAAAWPSAGPVPSPVQDPKSSNVISKDQQIVHKSRTMLGALGLVALGALYLEPRVLAHTHFNNLEILTFFSIAFKCYHYYYYFF